MNSPPEKEKVPQQLLNARSRIDQAVKDYFSFAHEMEKFLYEYVKGMVKGKDPKKGGFVLQLRHPKDSTVKGRPQVLVVQIVEHLRTALDYMIFEISKQNNPDLNEGDPQFVIANKKEEIELQAKRRLRYLTDEQKSFVEQIQPYHGNEISALVNRMAREGKHRRLLSVEDRTGFDIYLAPLEKRKDYEDCFIYPMEEEHAIFARPRDNALVLLEKYDAMSILKAMIEHVGEIIQISYCFFEGRPLKLSIERT